jgi:hypothetical protein
MSYITYPHVTSGEDTLPNRGPLFIITARSRDDNLPYYATENGFEIVKPFREKPFSESLLYFFSEPEAAEFVRDHGGGAFIPRVDRVSPEETVRVHEWLDEAHRDQMLQRFIQSEELRRQTVKKGDSGASRSR